MGGRGKGVGGEGSSGKQYQGMSLDDFTENIADKGGRALFAGGRPSGGVEQLAYDLANQGTQLSVWRGKNETRLYVNINTGRSFRKTDGYFVIDEKNKTVSVESNGKRTIPEREEYAKLSKEISVWLKNK